MKILLKLLVPMALAGAFSATNPAWADDAHQANKDDQAANVQSGIHDAWLKGKVEMALLLNRYLNSFRIDTDVNQSAVTLKGQVDSDIDSDLAEQIALGIKGVNSVDNELEIVPEKPQQTASNHEDKRKFLQRIEDLTLTARVKSKLLLNKNISATRINVDTNNSVVTLNGEVNNGQERDLVVKIAENTAKVSKVRDNLKIIPEGAELAGS